jgi:hypothetical protein
MDRGLVKIFWGCGDNGIIEYALMRARLNRKEKEAVTYLLDECMSQEEAAEKMCVSTRRFQEYWYSASDKLLSLPWLAAYAEELKK